MPGHDRFWFDDSQRRAPVAPDTGQSDPQQAVRWGQLRAFSRGALKDADLVAQSQVLQLQGSARTKVLGDVVGWLSGMGSLDFLGILVSGGRAVSSMTR
jgi:hypothetical protein